MSPSCAACPPRRRAVPLDPHPAPVEGCRVTVKAAVLGAGTWGTAFAKVLSDAGTDVTLWARRPELAQQINLGHQNGDYLPGIALPQSLYATHDAAAALADAELVAFAIPSQTLRVNLAEWAPVLPAEATLVSLMKGVELGTTKRMSEVIAEVAGAGLERIAVVSGPEPGARDRAGAADRHGRRVRGRGLRGRGADRLHGAVLPSVHEHRRHRLRARRRGQERHRAGVRHRPGHGLRRQHAGLDHHPRAGRDRPAGRRAGRRPDDVRRSGRPGRPGGHLLLAAVAQPQLRRAARPRRVARAGAGGDPRPDRRGCAVLPLGARTRPTPRRRHADHRGRRGGVLPRPDAAGHARAADVALGTQRAATTRR